MKVIRTMDYEGVKIYVLQHWTMWQYFFHYEGNLYMQHVWASPQWWRWLMLPFGYSLYSKDSLDEVEKSMLSGAMRSIEKLQGKDIIAEAKEDYDNKELVHA